MVVDHNGHVVGVAPHIRDVGPHVHDWSRVGTGPDGYDYSECSICGTRTSSSPSPAHAARRDWLLGQAEWDAEPKPVEPSTPEEVTAAIDELNEAQRDPSPEHKAAMPPAPTLSDPVADARNKAQEAKTKADEQRQKAEAARPQPEVAAAAPGEEQEAAKRGPGRPRKAAE